MSEDTANGVAPNFQEQGFMRPDEVVMIDGGKAGDPLVSPRLRDRVRPVAKMAQQATNRLVPFAIAGGDLDADQALADLGTGLYVGNLWYTNFSDRPACRVTGMTRFATFWVEGGEIVGPGKRASVRRHRVQHARLAAQGPDV